MLRSYVLVSLLNGTTDLGTRGKPLPDRLSRGKPLPDQPMGLTVGDKGETDARRRLSSCAPPNFNLNAEDAEIDAVLFVEPTVEIGWDRIFLLF